jgi:peptide/nickel transport system substrate-binding protein
VRSLFVRLTIVATTLLVSSAGPAAAENVLRFTGNSGGAVTMDPHASGLIADRAATMQMYEQLVDIDSNLAVVPQLAVAWKIIDPAHWEFELRKGVRFHDGTPFTAEDVVFSYERARAETSELQTPVANISSITAIGDPTLLITTTAPDPLLWMRVGFVAVMSKSW